MPPAGLAELSILGGLLAGFASSLHCVGMCGGIAASLMLGLSPDEGKSARARTLLIAQSGRITAYILAGALLGAIGSSAYLAFDRESAHLIMRWLGAAVLVYIGLSVAGWAPSLAGLDRFGGRIATLLGRTGTSRLGPAAPYFAGLLWGLLPCGMVYAALLYAMLAGNAAGGAAIMAGFGLGTLPAVTAAAFGTGLLADLGGRPGARLAVGLAIAALGVLSAALPWKTIAALCGIPID